MLSRFDRQMRGVAPTVLAEGERVELLGPLVCVSGTPGRGFVDYRDLAGLEGGELDELIARCVAAFAARGERFEWKTYAHDEPADLPQRLLAAGFVPEERETVVVAPVELIAAEPQLPAAVALREVTERADFDRIARMERRVWDEDNALAEMLESEHAAEPRSLTVVVAEAEGEVVCAAWVRFPEGVEFASLWGGATLAPWRRRGIYRATVAYRANLAAARGYRYLQVDASDESRPILERLGFTAVTTTTPFVWSPPGR